MPNVVRIVFLITAIGIVTSSQVVPVLAEEMLTVPAATTYVEPPSQRVRVSDAGVRGWTDADTRLAWYGRLTHPGTCVIAVALELPDGDSAEFALSVSPVDAASDAASATRMTASGDSASDRAEFGSVEIAAPGDYRFQLEGVSRTGQTFGTIRSLELSGAAIVDAEFNLTPRRNAASVHLWFPFEEGTEVAAFYNEITVETDPLWSYYMACGFHRGYFGIQVNSPTERRVIFSVWDSGSEAVDREKVSADDRVQLLEAGPDVVAHGFGNEGTGGHSHLIHDWKTGEKQRFLVTAKPDGKHTIYAGYFWFPEKEEWGLIARFRAPKDGGYLRGLYSFNENFVGANGQLQRKAAFSQQWIRDAGGRWTELTNARFTCDGHGRAHRSDYFVDVVDNAFQLSNGGFVAQRSKYGARLSREPSTDRPEVLRNAPEN